MSQLPGSVFNTAQDGENNTIEFDVAYSIRQNLVDAIRQLRERHGDDLRLLPMSGTSSGGGIFQHGQPQAATVVGLRFDPPAEARLRLDSNPDLRSLELDEIVIDTQSRRICCGAAITLDQLNRALVQELGHSYRVPGADLTSYQYAATGATFMTGGMGPQRRYFSDSVDTIALFDGQDRVEISGEALAGHAGTYGWSGIVSALCCRYYRFPENEISFALPVSDTPESLAQLLARLAPFTQLELPSQGTVSSRAGSDLILGLEHVSVASMQPLLRDSAAGEARLRALDLHQKCRDANAAGLIFVNALSQATIDEFLASLLDEPEAERFSIAGIDLEHAEIFNSGETMRAVREAIPYAARMQKPKGRFVFKNHTDANIRLAANSILQSMADLWRINRSYVDALNAYFQQHDSIVGEVLVYGHLNPYGVDPHNRVTMSCDDGPEFERCRAFLVEQRAIYYRALATLCESTGSEFVGGEKTADSELGIFAALGGPQRAPSLLRARFERQAKTVRAAAVMFNWRAPPPYA